MEWLILAHVLFSIFGLGPFLFGNILLRKQQTLSDLRHNVILLHKLELFPKIGGTLSVITGILLVLFGSYGSILQIWLICSLLLYISIIILVIGFISPTVNRLQHWLFHPSNRATTQLPPKQLVQLKIASNLFMITSVLAIIIFVLMILKPT
ncbi:MULTISPECIES: DUF2269 family protein [Bacillus]|uniref:DUF2269 family protein n=1 Tax=Bacillus TaxID=1386 RepID=UPI000BB6CB9F|nr:MULTISPECIES: DUF2269 family protein [Bacillus]